jgi:hypothetical protein
MNDNELLELKEQVAGLHEVLEALLTKECCKKE